MSKDIKAIYEHTNNVLEYFRSKENLTEREQLEYERFVELNTVFKGLKQRAEERERQA